uniref:CHK kinase-like domain-containing protein n=1 Tax=Bracon brevicornis TaxID=1563983 RepID=A0A6V7LYK0_9HYME
MSAPSDLMEWLTTEVIPKAIKNVNRTNMRYEFKCSQLENFHFMSEVFFAEIIFPNGQTDGKEQVLHVVVKVPPPNVHPRDKINMNKFFSNEILFYKEFVENSSLYPRIFYGTSEEIDKTVIVMENVRQTRGFAMCPQLYDIPLKYVMSAVKELGRFHGYGYVMKDRRPDKLKNIIGKLQDGRFIDGEPFHIIINIVGTRPIEWLRTIDYDSTFCDKMEKIFANAYENIMIDAIKPVEPLAVLIHGDFTGSNMFFKETSTGLDTMLIDFGMSRYTSPAIDLCTLLFLNATTDDRKYRFDNIFKAYHDSLLEYLSNAGIIQIEEYAIEKMLADYKRRAAFGYMIAVYFLPTLRGCLKDIPGDIRVQSRQRVIEIANMIKAGGGEAASRMFGEMLIELREAGCLDHFLM